MFKVLHRTIDANKQPLFVCKVHVLTQNHKLIVVSKAIALMLTYTTLLQIVKNIYW